MIRHNLLGFILKQVLGKMVAPLGDKADALLEKFVKQNESFFRHDEVMLDWLNVIELGVKIDTDDEVTYGGATQETKVLDLNKGSRAFDISDRLDLTKHTSRKLEGVCKLKADANSHKCSFLPEKYNPYFRNNTQQMALIFKKEDPSRLAE
jgi:hypothetical protein